MQTNVLAYLEHSAACFPQKTALEDETTCLTFQALWDQGRRVGTALARKIGGHNRPVAVLAGRNAATVLAFLGVLYSGNYYVPVDRNMPRQRMERLLQRLAPAALLYAEEDKALAESLSPAPVSLRESAQIPADGALLSSLVMETPFVVLCREDCAGLCPVCGANLNEVDCGHMAQLDAEREQERLSASPFAALAGLDLTGSDEAPAAGAAPEE